MRAAALALAILSILPLLGAAVSPVIHADSTQPAALTSSGQRPDATLAAAPLKNHLTGPQPFISILCKFADEDDEPLPPAYFEGLFGAARPGLADYWREVSYGQISLEGSRTVGWYALSRPSTEYLAVTETEARLNPADGRLYTGGGRRCPLPGLCGDQPYLQQDPGRAGLGRQAMPGAGRCVALLRRDLALAAHVCKAADGGARDRAIPLAWRIPQPAATKSTATCGMP